ncbi:MAG TPA: secretin N-terminal domain-containing protein [Pyrinomonadaceae bacterium]|nr:secretin N-terminal domain-containing protein [Pyrinomonadaceae bacterium]
MKLKIRWHSIVSLIIVACLLSVPVMALGKKGKDHFDRGMKLEQAQKWEQAAQEFTLALAADPSNVDYQLHYRRSLFNASQTFMQQGRSLAEQRDYVGAYNAFRQAFGYDPVNQLAVSEMERMLRLQEVKEGMTAGPTAGGDGVTRSEPADGGGTPSAPTTAKPQEPAPSSIQGPARVINYSGDLKAFIRMMADQLNLNVMFDRQTFIQPRSIDVNLRDVTAAKALDWIFLQEGLFFQKLDHRTILVAGQDRRQQYQQLVVRTFFISNADPTKATDLISRVLPASVGRPQAIVWPDKDTNSITVRDTAENVQLIGELLQSIDKDRAEVVMDVNIYEVSRTDLLQFGNQLGDDSSLTTLGGVRAMGSPLGQLSRVITGTGATAVGLPASFGAALILPASSIQALQSRNHTRLLASTQVHAFNGEESTARIGQRVPVQTASAFPFGVQTGTPNNNTGFPTGGFPVINYEPTGLTLNFTPQVFPNLDVQVKMKIKSNDVFGASSVGGLLTPTFTEREITGTARIQNNRTMMLASVTTDTQSNGRKGLPILGLVPVLGRLFTSPTKDNRQVDIVIAVTPRVLRAPALTPRDEEMRKSGTLTAPTTGLIEAMLRETERDEQIAAARRIPKEVAVQLADAPVTYVPAPIANGQASANTNKAENAVAASATTAQVTSVSQNKDTVPVKTQSAVLTEPVKQSATSNRDLAAAQTDAAMPQPKTVAVSTQTDPPAPRSMDVASALKNVVSPTTNVSTTASPAKSDATVSNAVEQLALKSEKTDANAKPNKRAGGVMELRLAPEKAEMFVGEKRQLTVKVNSDAPLGLALVTLRFDPRVIKINGVSAGKIFANAKIAPTITQSTDQSGMLLVSVAPVAGSTVSGEGALLNIEVEAIGAGDSALVFDLSNVHLVAADGRPTMLDLGSSKLTVKQPDAPAPKPAPDQPRPPATKP